MKNKLSDPLAKRSGCPINLRMEVLADRRSLVIIRDMIGCGMV